MKRMTSASGSLSLGNAEAEVGAACKKTPPIKTPPLCLRRKEGTCRGDTSGDWLVAGNEVAQWVNNLDIIEDKIKYREANLKKFWSHCEAAKR